jgi:predicted MPP superfamily phosphohydrolase
MPSPILPTAVELLLVLLALFGHAALWVGLNNRLHAMPIKRSHLKAISAMVHFGTLAVPAVFAAWLWTERRTATDWLAPIDRSPIALFYCLLCLGMAVVHLPRWLYLRWVILRRAWQHGERVALVDMVQQLGSYPGRGLQYSVGKYVPFNQSMWIEFTHKQVPLPRLPVELVGLRIGHLTDLHFSGRVQPEFFDRVIDQLNQLKPDVVLLTGDVCDKEKCLPWIVPLLSKVHAPCGKFFILGNHDNRLADELLLRRTIAETGFVDVGGRQLVHCVCNVPLLLAGNERPWFDLADELKPTLKSPPQHDDAALKILLSHSPDQVGWARRYGFDLMLSGHTHGGQIRFPVIGPVVCPSWYGLRYASGLFLNERPVVHVCRGVSGLFPIRWNCLPEVTILTLSRLR